MLTRHTLATVPRVCAIVVNCGEPPIVHDCLRSILASAYPELELLLVDNGSPCDVRQRLRAAFPQIRWLCNAKNIGYAAALNQGLDDCLSRGVELAWVMNNDVVVERDTLSALVDAALAHPRAGIVAPIVREPKCNGTLEFSGFRFHPVTGRMRRLRPEEVFTRAEDRWAEVDSQHGCSILVRLAAVERCGSFWERLNLYFEETELCLRFRDQGFSTIVVRDARVLHQGSATMSSRLWLKALLLLRNLFLVQLRRLRGSRRAAFVAYFFALHLPSFVLKGAFHVLRCALGSLAGCAAVAAREAAYRVAGWLGSPRTDGAILLSYHVFPPERRLSLYEGILSVSPSALVEHCRVLRQEAELVPIAQALLAARSAPHPGALRGRPLVAVSVDDVEASNLAFLIDTLLEHRIPATLFVIAATLDRRPVVLGQERLARMREVGVEVGSHGFHHRDVTALAGDHRDEEIDASRRLVEDRLGLRCEMFSYPFGHHDAAAADAVDRAGYAWGLTCRASRLRGDWHALCAPRVEVVRWDSGATVLAKVTGRCDRAMALWRGVQACRAWWRKGTA